MQYGLYIVGTPIGNLGDFSPRAVDVLRNVDLIAAEDTRVFGKLASHFDIKTKRISCHEHNERDVVPELIEKLRTGLSIAVVTDAGKNYSPALIANYVYDLAKEYNQFYHDCSILKEQDQAVRCFRQLLSETVADVIKRGMSLLGIEMPNRM